MKLLIEPRNGRSLVAAREYLETVRRDLGMDILSLVAPDGTVILRTRPPYTTGDTLAADPMIRQVTTTGQGSSGDVILELERLDVEGTGLLERCMAVAGESRGMLTGTAVPVRQGKDEVGTLSASFNRMAETLLRQRQEIESRQKELEDLSKELQSINANYVEMLGFVAHELQNPLASAMMSLYTVKDGYLGAVTPAQRKSLDSVAQSLDYFHDFEKFSRLDTPECAGQRGSGLGLYICKEIVRKLGGEIWAESKAGEWVRFGFSVPK